MSLPCLLKERLRGISFSLKGGKGALLLKREKGLSLRPLKRWEWASLLLRGGKGGPSSFKEGAAFIHILLDEKGRDIPSSERERMGALSF